MKPLHFGRRALVFLLPVLLPAAGCTALPKKETAFSPKLSGSYSVETVLHYGDSQTAAMTLMRCGKGIWDADFTEPAQLSGVRLSLEGDAVSADYKGLAFTVPKSALPAKSMLCILTEVLDSLDTPDGIACTAAEDGGYVFAGEAEAGRYTVTFTGEGLLTAFEMPCQPLSAEFRDHRCGGLTTSAITEQPETTVSGAKQEGVPQ